MEPCWWSGSLSEASNHGEVGPFGWDLFVWCVFDTAHWTARYHRRSLRIPLSFPFIYENTISQELGAERDAPVDCAVMAVCGQILLYPQLLWNEPAFTCSWCVGANSKPTQVTNPGWVQRPPAHDPATDTSSGHRCVRHSRSPPWRSQSPWPPTRDPGSEVWSGK